MIKLHITRVVGRTDGYALILCLNRLLSDLCADRLKYRRLMPLVVLFIKGNTMKHNRIKKMLSMLLASLTLLCLFVSCTTPKDPVDTAGAQGTETDGVQSGDTTGAPDETTPPVDENGYLLDNLPSDLRYDGKKVRFLVWSDVENVEFYVKEQTGESVNDAIYFRNMAVEDRLGITMEFSEALGNYNNQKGFVEAAENMIMSGAELDIMAAYSLTAAGLVTKNLGSNLNELEYLDFDMPWWPSKLVEESQINGNVYLCSGDLSTNMLHKMHAVFFNRPMCESYGINTDELYTTALNGQWLLDDMLEMTANVYEDLNSDGAKDKDDKYGLFMCDNYFDVFFYASGLRIIDHNTDGAPQISDSYGGEKAIDLTIKLGSFFAEQLGGFFVKNFTEGIQMANDKAMMIVSRCDIASKRLCLAEGLDYGVLPVPKYSADQESYTSCLAFPCTMYVVSQSSKEPQMTGAVLEALCSEGYRTITPALFESTMKYKYANDSTTAQVYDIIRSTVTFDLGRLFHMNLNQMITKFRTACSKNDGTFASSVKANSDVALKLLQTLNDTLK